MRLSLITLSTAAAIVFAGSAHADNVHSCGALPELPAIFDVESATVDDIKLVASEYQAYQDENTTFIDCLKETVKSDDIQGLKKKQRKAAMKMMDEEMQTTVKNEEEFADTFNASFTEWKEKRMAASQ